MTHNRFTTITVLIVIFISIPAYPMLILKQEKKHSPAYLCIRERKKKDPLIPQNQEYDGFEHIITFGKIVLQNTGTIMKTVETTATMVIANIATQIVTGKKLDDFIRDRQNRRGYDPDESRRQKECKELERQEDRDARIKNGVSMNSACVWNAKKGCFYDYDGNLLQIVGGSSSEEPQTDIIYTSISLPVINNAQPVDESIVSTPQVFENKIRQVDYENNPGDREWLQDFANKICPSGGYTIGDITPLNTPVHSEEDIQSIIVAANFSPNPNNQKPNKPKNDKDSHDWHEYAEKIQESIGHHIAEEGMEHVIDESLDNVCKKLDKDKDPLKEPTVTNYHLQ